MWRRAENAHERRAFPMRRSGLLVSGRGRRPISGLSLCGKKSRSCARKRCGAEKLRLGAVAARCALPLRSVNAKKLESGLGQTKPRKLQRPFGRRITQAGDADAARKPPFNGGLDQSRRDKCHRYRHVDLTNAALLARGKEGAGGRFRASVSAAKNPVPGARKGVGAESFA